MKIFILLQESCTNVRLPKKKKLNLIEICETLKNAAEKSRTSEPAGLSTKPLKAEQSSITQNNVHVQVRFFFFSVYSWNYHTYWYKKLKLLIWFEKLLHNLLLMKYKLQKSNSKWSPFDLMLGCALIAVRITSIGKWSTASTSFCFNDSRLWWYLDRPCPLKLTTICSRVD